MDLVIKHLGSVEHIENLLAKNINYFSSIFSGCRLKIHNVLHLIDNVPSYFVSTIQNLNRYKEHKL